MPGFKTKVCTTQRVRPTLYWKLSSQTRTVAIEITMWCHHRHFNKYSSTSLNQSQHVNTRWSEKFPRQMWLSPQGQNVSFFLHTKQDSCYRGFVWSADLTKAQIVCIYLPCDPSALWSFLLENSTEQTQTSAALCNTIQQTELFSIIGTHFSAKILFLQCKQGGHDSAAWSFYLKELSQQRYSSDITECRQRSARARWGDFYSCLRFRLSVEADADTVERRHLVLFQLICPE